MKTLEYTFVDKSEWGDGPWQSEPDKLQWPDAETGLPCLIVRGPTGSLCGYVGVAPGHPLHGVDFGGGRVNFDVHGGITFSGACVEREHGICHIPEPGEPEHVYWFGFDCAHGGDLMPKHEADGRKYYPAFLKEMEARRATMFEAFGMDRYRDTYKTIAYVQAECARLAQQLKGE